jgi:hypothetical protein
MNSLTDTAIYTDWTGLLSHHKHICICPGLSLNPNIPYIQVHKFNTKSSLYPLLKMTDRDAADTYSKQNTNTATHAHLVSASTQSWQITHMTHHLSSISMSHTKKTPK